MLNVNQATSVHCYLNCNFSLQGKAPSERKPNVLNFEELNNEKFES